MSDAQSRRAQRVEQNRQSILSHARNIAAEDGIDAVTYTAIAARAGFSRQTLYRHWPTRRKLLAAMTHNGPHTDYPTPSPDAVLVLRDFLRSLRDGMDDPGLAGTVTGLIAGAEHDHDTADALTALVADRVAALDDVLAPADLALTVLGNAWFMGPVLYCRFIARIPVTDDLIDHIVESGLTRRSGSIVQ